MGKRKKGAKRAAATATDTPLYDGLVAELGFAPHEQPQTGGCRHHPATPGLLEDNFS